jgi:hypothetical protein
MTSRDDGDDDQRHDPLAVATYVSSLRGENLTGKEPQGKPVPALAK